MEDSSSNPGNHYDRVTAAWDVMLGPDWHHGVFERCDEDLAAATTELSRLMTEAAAVRPGSDVLDAGCGSGAQACRLGRDHGARVLGISTSEAGVTRARARARAAGLADRVRFERRDALDTKLGGGSFDVVWSLESAQYMIPQERMIAEFARLLRPGGRLALCDVMLCRALTLRDLRRHHDEFSLITEAFGEGRLRPAVEYAELAVRHGLTVIGREDLGERVRLTYPRWRERAEQTREPVVALIGETAWERFRDACGVLEAFFADGTMSYALISAVKPVR